jgi:hypothetical protein
MQRPPALRVLWIGALAALAASPARTEAAEEAVPASLAPVLDGKPARWRLNPLQAAKPDYSVAQYDGKPVLVIGPGGLTLLTAAPLGHDVEIRAQLRLTSPQDRGCSVAAIGGMKAPADDGKNPLALGLALLAGPAPEGFQWSLRPLPGEKTAVYGTYSLATLPRNRLTWPDLVRRRVEQDVASETAPERHWLSLRIVLRKHAACFYLDDRLLREARHPRLDTAGLFRLDLTHGAQLASLSVRDLPPEEPRFETVALDGYLNSGHFQGQALRREGLPGAGKTVTVGGVPLLLAVDRQGRDHIDLKPSWLRCGLLEGGFDGWSGDTPRWLGALSRDPARLQLRVRNRPYSKIHLLAAFSSESDTIPKVTVQFYRPNHGHPVHFTGRVPLFTATGQGHALPVQLADGKKGRLHLVSIPLEPDGPASLSDLDHVELELTKDVHVYRSYPDPIYYSQHGAGLPSGVHVFALTLEQPAVTVDLLPDRLAHIWTAPEHPSYTARLRNLTNSEQPIELELRTTSHDGTEKETVRREVKVAAGAEQLVKLPLSLRRHGFHAVELKVRSAGEIRTQRRSLAYLHPDTRERGGWEEGKGPIFGFWDWGGGHLTLGGLDRLRVMAAAGMESSMGSFASLPKEEQDYLASIGAQSFFLAYQLAMTREVLGVDWDPKKPAAMQAALLKFLKAQPMARPSKVNKPELAVFFAEPLLGPVSYMSLPEYYGEPPHQMTAEERARYQQFLDQFVIAATAIKKEWPQAKCLFPWGLPTFLIPFLRQSKEARDLIDGPAIDIVLFERMPEMQMHQVTYASLLWQFRQEWKKTGKPWPNLMTIEGPAVSPALPGALTPEQEADHMVRGILLLAAYGTTRHLGFPTPFHCAGSWGETHYGGGLCDPQPLLSPRPVYSAYAALTRQLNRMNFVKMVPTGSATIFCLQFKHYKTGNLLHVLWTVRGKRPVSVKAARGAKLTVYDVMDNPQTAAEKDGQATFVTTPAPCYLHGLTADPVITLGSPDHSDSRPGPNTVRLAELGDGSWRQSGERDPDYENCHPEFIRKFPRKMSLRAVPAEGHGKALAIHLEKQDRQRRTMPFYTALTPARPLPFPGRASHLGLWVRAASDWGRVVYCLRDAKGERWLSVGKKGEWNVDDVHSWSTFCFDGWRYLRFEMPANAPYDVYREPGTSFWGPYGQGDGIVDLPLTLEKILVERRTHVITGTELVAASADDVLLGGLHAEYEAPADRTEEAVRQSRLRMPLPAAPPDLVNPLRKLQEKGAAPGPAVTKVAAPQREYDGRRCHVHFEPVAGAKTYDVWVSPYADGRGAVLLGEKWAAPGQLLTGLSPNIDLYLFVVSTDKAGKASKPSKSLKINLKDMFPMK